MLVLLDNYDSFSHNLVQLFGALGHEPRVFRNDRITLSELIRLHPTGLIVSPGPGRPEEAGISIDAIGEFLGRIPILGICLGHQCLATALGAKVVRGFPRHGKTSPVFHDGRDLLRGVPSPFDAARYHSLVVDRASLPDSLMVRAETADGAVMALTAQGFSAFGLQFHPESYMTPFGKRMAANYLDLVG